MVSRRTLGLSFFAIAGFAMLVALLGGLLNAGTPMGSAIRLTSPLGGLSEGLTASGFLAVGFVLKRSDLGGERIWRIAELYTLGLGIPTAAVLLLLLFDHHGLVGFGRQSATFYVISSGGLVGLLTGSLTELRNETGEAKALNERNEVFLRLFRHDIRNSMNLIQGYAARLADGEGDSRRPMRVVRNHVDHVLRLSEAARQLDRLETGGPREDVDLAAVARERVDALEIEHPDVEFDRALPTHAWVRGDDLLRSVVDNLLRNAIEHNVDDDLTVRVEVSAPSSSDGRVELTVTDDGEGFDEKQLRVHTAFVEDELQHGNGIGLWLVRWIVTSYGGDVRIETRDDSGARVTVELLPAAGPHSSDASGRADARDESPHRARSGDPRTEGRTDSRLRTRGIETRTVRSIVDEPAVLPPHVIPK